MLDRRGFLKFIGGAAVGTLATPVVWKGLDDISIWSQNWPWIPSLQYGNHENTASYPHAFFGARYYSYGRRG